MLDLHIILRHGFRIFNIHGRNGAARADVRIGQDESLSLQAGSNNE